VLVLEVGHVLFVLFVIIGDVEHEALVDQIVCLFGSV
jgi:hypothetical protein